MLARVVLLAMAAALPAVTADWNAQFAADYLDARQEQWFAWPTANEDKSGPCLSCHTGLTYLLARPALRRVLGESAPTRYESGLLDSIRRRLSLDKPDRFAPREKEPMASQLLGVESVLAPLLLSMNDAGKDTVSRDTEQAFDRMWSLQVKAGQAKGSWHWNSLDLDRWEEPQSAFYGASLAALAVGVAPGDYRNDPRSRMNREMLLTYLQNHQRAQPLHNRLVLVWAAAHLPGALQEAERQSIIDAVLRSQNTDGGWTIQSLGPWAKHPRAPRSPGSNAYATALAGFVLQRAGVPESHSAVGRALSWLRTRQDSKGGFWEAMSMNKRYDAGSMPAHFMRDAATAFATLALTEANAHRVQLPASSHSARKASDGSMSVIRRAGR